MPCGRVVLKLALHGIYQVNLFFSNHTPCACTFADDRLWTENKMAVNKTKNGDHACPLACMLCSLVLAAHAPEHLALQCSHYSGS